MNFACAMQAAGGSVLQVSSAPTKPPVCVVTSASLALYTWVDLRGRSLRVLCAFKSCARVRLPMPITSSKQEVRPGVLKAKRLRNGLVLSLPRRRYSGRPIPAAYSWSEAIEEIEGGAYNGQFWCFDPRSRDRQSDPRPRGGRRRLRPCQRPPPAQSKPLSDCPLTRSRAGGSRRHRRSRPGRSAVTRREPQPLSRTLHSCGDLRGAAGCHGRRPCPCRGHAALRQ